MILSDRSIQEEIAAGRIVIEPLGEGTVQPSSVDLHVDRYFRVFRNDTTPFIDPKQPQQDLTELVEVDDGRAFILHPSEFVLGSTLERVALPDDLVARLEGKALALDTEVPTPAGWTTMGDLEPGDLVFDERGLPTPVAAVTATMLDRPCREVVFCDGASVVADAAHRWETVDTSATPRGAHARGLRTTEDIARALTTVGKPSHLVATCTPVRYPAGEFPEPRWRPESSRAIVEVREVAAVPVRCIQVASPRGLYLVTRSYIPTHNSSLGRLGLLIHSTAGFVDAGWDGHLTLELSNVANLPIAIYPGMKIGQISFLRMTSAAQHAYGSAAAGSKYQGQRGPTPSRYYLNFRERQ